MKIGIIGAGNIGATLARKLAASGHEIKIANSQGPESLRNLAYEVGATPVTKEEAVRDVETIILSIPFAKYPHLAPLFSDLPADVVIIDTSNYYPFRDGSIIEVDRGKPESVWVGEQIGRPVVKAWNAVLALTLADRARPKGAPERIAVPVASDDQKTAIIAAELVDSTGFDAVYSGILEDSWRQQPGTPAYCTELTASELTLALRSANKSRAPINRDTIIEQALASGGNFSHDEIVARNRSITA